MAFVVPNRHFRPARVHSSQRGDVMTKRFFVPTAFLFLFVVVIMGFVLVVLGLCVLALFMPVVLVIAGLYIMVRGTFLPMPWRAIAGICLIAIGAVWLGWTW